jgi:DNA-binding IclR family transcriptional regulator
MADDEGNRRYRAPALEKGLDILERLAVAEAPMTVNDIRAELSRSYGELFRMVQVLEYRGYIERDQVTDGYVLTDRLLSLGMHQPAMMSLVETALPEMRKLADQAGQSCHLAVHTRGDMVVIARMESGEQLGFSVRVGYRQPLTATASGAVLYAFQPEDVRRRWEALFAPDPTLDLAAFRRHADRVRQRGMDEEVSTSVRGIVDLSAPIMRGGAAAAALTMPFLERLKPGVGQDAAACLVRAAAQRISVQLTPSDGRL